MPVTSFSMYMPILWESYKQKLSFATYTSQMPINITVRFGVIGPVTFCAGDTQEAFYDAIFMEYKTRG